MPQVNQEVAELVRDMLKSMIVEEVKKRLPVAIEEYKVSHNFCCSTLANISQQQTARSWNPVTYLKKFIYRTSNALPDLDPTISASTDDIPAETNTPIPLAMLDEFANVYPHYNMDPWEFNFGLLVAIQKLKYSVITIGELDCYIGLIPTYRHLKDQEMAGKRQPLSQYTAWIAMMAPFSGYDEEVITIEKLNRFIASAEGKAIHASFRGVSDEYFIVADVGET